MNDDANDGANDEANDGRAVGDAPAAPPEPPWAVEFLAERLVDARRGGPPVVAERVAATVKRADTAYHVQALVNAAVWPDVQPAAWKVGADSRESIPTAAPLMPALVHSSAASIAASSFRTRIVEAEIAYRFGADLPPRGTPYGIDEVAEAIAGMHAAIEIVDGRIAEFPGATSLAKLADHGVNGGFVLGDGVGNWRRIDLRKQSVVLSLDGKVHERAIGSHALGNPSVLLPWFVAWLGRQDGRGVRAGDVVTTGSWTKVVEAKPKQRVAVDFEGIGGASFTFV